LIVKKQAGRRRDQKPAPPFSAEALRTIERRGLVRGGFRDFYYGFMTLPVPALLGLFILVFILVNLAFAALYFITGGIAGARPGDFGDDVFFSVQTLSTTGYGALYPKSQTANIIASFEIMAGLLGTALATGMLFARLSRPRAHVLFSRVAVLHKRNGRDTLMFRVSNQRRNQITDARMTVITLQDETDDHGQVMRRQAELKLERDRSPVFSLSWSVMHVVDETSPLFGLDAAAMARCGTVLICTLNGLDDTLLATVVARYFYGAEDIRFGHRFVDIFDRHEDGSFAIDYTKFHDTIE
jgi:inward rectifier potassium channel